LEAGRSLKNAIEFFCGNVCFEAINSLAVKDIKFAVPEEMRRPEKTFTLFSRAALVES
jgi:hypothetical protein